MQTVDALPAISLKGIRKSHNGRAVVNDLSLAIRQGEFFSLLGPSGCGKTTILRLIAGLDECEAGSIEVLGRSLAGVPAHRRPATIVFQNHALFPHLNVFDNIAFGLELRRVPRKEIQSRVSELLDLVRLPGFEKRMPRQLSGGQSQRIALARALAPRPSLLLLDEPLSALDSKLRREMQVELKRIQQDLRMAFFYVTHDQEEAFALSDRMAVVRDGILLQTGAPAELYERPNCAFVAAFVGEGNFIAAEKLEGGFAGSGGEHLFVRPENVFVSKSGASGAEAASSPERFWPGRVTQSLYAGRDSRLEIESPLGKIIARIPHGSGIAEGDRVQFHWKRERASLLRGDGGNVSA